MTQIKVGIVVSRYNSSVTESLLEAAQKVLVSAQITVWRVPGAFEIPLAVQQLIRKKKPHAVVALGCVLKGETPHNEHIAREVAAALMQISLDQNTPVAFGVLTPNNYAQAKARSGKNSSSNKGREAALAALEMIELLGENFRRK